MKTSKQQLSCGECGNRTHELYQGKRGKIYVECTRCNNVSVISVLTPRIDISPAPGYTAQLAPF
jgi:uncharacterized Zn finger protein